MQEQELRIRCLELSLEYKSNRNPIDEARAYFDFITGKSDSKILEAARSLAEVVNAKA